ncbi:circadian clock protein KaiC [Pelomonas saccharophila]|uniref:non-specific serine/threonine protein kinase n=1 Tax=Roseateles saccharophilus TaxID=304 RepID=A0ABU1YRI5_ROSSA|nr:ATPase domain-containing protein [Roseateles saccharophilus]MDR7271473.1 circadian clock protein KaiC [Roseateles saccharophilus]
MTAGKTRSATGVPGLDEVLHGGLIAGQLYLVDGEPGAGKTTLALQYLMQGVREGEPCLYVTLGETAAELRAGAASHGWALDGVEIVELVAAESDLFGDSDLTMYHPSEVELSETTRRVLEAVERCKPRRMVLDSLSELRLLAQASLRYRRQILALKQFFVGRGCTVLFLDDRSSEGADTQLHSIAHGVIALERHVPAYGPAQRQLRITKFRGSDFISGQQDLLIRRGGLEVFPRLRPGQHGATYQRDVVPSGVPALDQLLGGGTDRGTATLLVGPAGSGKSTIAAQYAVMAAKRGGHAAIFTFEEGRKLLLDRLASLGMVAEEGIGPGKLQVRQIDAAEVLPSQFANIVRTSVETDGASVVVIDSLNGYLNAMPEERALVTQLHELLTYLNNHGVATFVVATQSGMMGSNMRNPVDTSYLADAVVLFRMYEHHGAVRKAISVIKKRSGWHEDTIRQLWFDGEGVHLGPPLMNLRGVLAGVPVEVTVRHEGEPGDDRAGRR